MARALDTYRGERRLKWKEARRNIEVHSFEPARLWSTYTLPPFKNLSKTAQERRYREAEKRTQANLDALKNWLTAIRSKLLKRFVLSNREVAVFLMARDADPTAHDAT